GAVGWLACPVMLVFEGFAPVVELLGYLTMTVLAVTGLLSWAAFGAFMMLALGMGMVLSACALLLEELAFRTYPKPRHLVQLLAAIVVESCGYRQINAWWRIVGLTQWVTQRKQRWGDMQRVGSGQPGQSPGA
ncbi:MAG TPA: glycosyltransferase family 2 protein, partial [Methylibium sp.]